MRFLLISIVLAHVFGAGCKSDTPKLDSPQATLKAFFQAVNKGKIPGDSEYYFGDTIERKLWQARCESRGCEMVKFKIIEELELGERGAVLLVDYQVFGNKQQSTMTGVRSKVRFERQGKDWKIVQFGERLKARQNEGLPAEKRVQLDAGSPLDAGGGAPAN